MTIAMPEHDRKLAVPAASSYCPELGVTHRLGGYVLDYATRLVMSGFDYYSLRRNVPSGISTAAEELALQLPYETVCLVGLLADKRLLAGSPDEAKSALLNCARTDYERAAVEHVFEAEKKLVTDPKLAKVFDDLFARGPDEKRLFQTTDTFLRVPAGKQNPAKPDCADSKGRKSWAREFGIGNEVIGVVYVPEGDGRVVPVTNDLLGVWDQVTGLPRVTEDDYPINPTFTTRFWFNPYPRKDEISGYRDTGILRGSYWRIMDGVIRYNDSIVVVADHERWLGSGYSGYRPVKGQFEIEVSMKKKFRR